HCCLKCDPLHGGSWNERGVCDSGNDPGKLDHEFAVLQQSLNS
ncbi:hypothetical protein TGPRC2_318400B, partial [Toxoplasma gondii TgCatPRC2]